MLKIRKNRLEADKYFDQFSLNLTVKCCRTVSLNDWKGTRGGWGGPLCGLILPRVSLGVFYWEGAARVCVPLRGRCCGHGAGEMGRERGCKATSRISGWIAGELPRSSLKTLFCGVGGEARQPSEVSTLHRKPLRWEIPFGSSAFLLVIL